MPYVLSLSDQEGSDRHFQSVTDAMAFYETLQSHEGGSRLNGSEELRCSERNTFVTLFPGLSVQTVTSELESVWEWAPEDRLKIRPILKERYRVKT